MSTLNRSNWDNDQPTDVDRWLEIYSQDDNLFWSTDTGHIQNVLDGLIERLETAKADAWEEGYAAGDADAFTIDRLDTPNPHREHSHTVTHGAFGDPYCLTCGIDLEDTK